MNCFYHSQTNAQTQCIQCKKYICSECHDSEFEGFCYSCSIDFRSGSKEFNVAESYEKKYSTINKIIGWYEIVGGTIGVILVIYTGIRLIESMNSLGMVLFFLFTILFLFSILSGFLLLRNNKTGETLSILVQAIQIPQFIIKGTAYSFVAGAKFTLQYYKNFGIGYKIDFGVFSEFNFYINSNVNGFLIGINLVPIILIFLLFRSKKNKKFINDQNVELSQ